MSDYVPKPDLEHINAPPSSPVRDLAFMGLGIIAILAVLFVVLGAAGEWAFSWMSPQAEVKVFGGIPHSMGKNALTNPELSTIFGKLQSNAHEPDLKIAIWCDETPNALALPGRQILITSALLEDVKTDVGLAFVVAHEMGHFHHRHHLRGLGRGLGFTLGMLILGVGDANAGLSTVFANLMSRAYSRDQESEADQYAMSLVLKTYGHLNGATEFFDARVADEGTLEKATSLMHTHPLSADRIQAIQERARLAPVLPQAMGQPLTTKNPCPL